jgi:hypothetical protein
MKWADCTLTNLQPALQKEKSTDNILLVAEFETIYAIVYIGIVASPKQLIQGGINDQRHDESAAPG